MFSKYRIVEKNEKFIPEERYCLFFWDAFREYVDASAPLQIRITITVRRDTLAEAEQFLKDHIANDKKKEKRHVKFHKFANNPNKTN